MRLSEHLYLGDKARKRRFAILQGLREGSFQPDVYAITPPESRGQILTIYPAPMLRPGRHEKADLLILGLAVGRREAFEVVRQMIDEIYRETGDFVSAEWKE